MNSKLKRNLRWLHVVDRLIPLLRISNLRVRGRYAASQARHRKAIRLFERTIRNANEVGMPYLEALAMLDLAAVCETDRDETRAKAIELLNEMESVIPRAESWLLGDQYDESVVAPEFDLEAWEREHSSILSGRSPFQS